MRPPVSVVVPCYNEQAGLPALFARLDALLRDGGRGWRGAVLCDGSRGPTLAVPRIPFRSDGFASVAEIMLRALLAGYRVRELPMRLGARRFGESKLKIGDAIVAQASLLMLAATLVATRRLRALVPGVPVMH